MALDIASYAPTSSSVGFLIPRDTIVFVEQSGTPIAVSVGDCLLLPTDTNGIANTFVAPTAASIGTVASAVCSDGFFGIALDSATGVAGEKIRVQIRGLVNATTVAATVWGADAAFVPNTSKQLVVNPTATAGDANKKIVALSIASEGADPTVARPRAVLFDGVNGFGRSGGAA